MKYMKVGMKPDIFQTDGNITTVATDLAASDITLHINDSAFHLHKFPLLSKCGRLHSLVSDIPDEVVRFGEFPGGAAAFDLCAKFCYGIAITLNAHNVLSVRCAAEYLGMTENLEKGNLIFKLEVFLNSSVFKAWKDSIITLKTTKALLPWSQDLNMVSRCIDAIASKTSVDPSKVDWSFTYTRMNSTCGSCNTPPCTGSWSQRYGLVPIDWWVEDISDLDMELYCKVILAIKSKGRMSPQLIGEALRVYAYRWLPGMANDGQHLLQHLVNKSPNDVAESEHRWVLEMIVKLLPAEEDSCLFIFMMRLLKAATVLGVESYWREELVKRIGIQLKEASLNDLLILTRNDEGFYDVDMLQRIVEQFFKQSAQSGHCSALKRGEKQVRDGEYKKVERRRCHSAEQLDLELDGTDQIVRQNSTEDAAIQAANVQVAKLVDGYLIEIANDTNLPLAKFMCLADLVPDSARSVHDGLYRAIDIFLKEHPALSKSEKRRLCGLMDCRKLSIDVCMHAAQNERLPLRVVVHVLFCEQLRATSKAGGVHLPEGARDGVVAGGRVAPLKGRLPAPPPPPPAAAIDHDHSGSSGLNSNPSQEEACSTIIPSSRSSHEAAGSTTTHTSSSRHSHDHLHQGWDQSLRHAMEVEALREKVSTMAHANGTFHHHHHQQHPHHHQYQQGQQQQQHHHHHELHNQHEGGHLQAFLRHHPKARSLLSNPKRILNKLLSGRSAATSTTSSGSIKDSSDVSKSSGSSVSSSVPSSKDGIMPKCTILGRHSIS